MARTVYVLFMLLVQIIWLAILGVLFLAGGWLIVVCVGPSKEDIVEVVFFPARMAKEALD